MKQVKLIIITFVVTVLLGGCVQAPVIPPTGLIYSDFDAPISTISASNDLGSKRGVSTVKSVLGLFSWGDGSVKAAANNGGITQLRHLDYKFFNLLFIYQRYDTVAYGD